jgi:hypothetical protein
VAAMQKATAATFSEVFIVVQSGLPKRRFHLSGIPSFLSCESDQPEIAENSITLAIDEAVGSESGISMLHG